jgi:putative transposase
VIIHSGMASEFFHVYNRGVDKRLIFIDDYDYVRFLESLYLNNSTKNGLVNSWRWFKFQNPLATPLDFIKISEDDMLVEIIAYCLNPNHFHLEIKEIREKGMETLMHKQGTSYTMYFNKRHDRSGSLLQGKYQRKEIDTEDLILYVSAYVNGNPEIHKVGLARNWPYSSFAQYTGKESKFDFINCSKNFVLEQLSKKKTYEQYMNEVIEQSSKVKKNMKLLTFE